MTKFLTLFVTALMLSLTTPAAFAKDTCVSDPNCNAKPDGSNESTVTTPGAGETKGHCPCEDDPHRLTDNPSKLNPPSSAPGSTGTSGNQVQ